jgi:hypothetical protein
MKTRTCFVSNSSSSSFIIIGTSDEKYKDCSIDGVDTIYPDDDVTVLVGQILADEEYLDFDGISSEEVLKAFDSVASKLGIDKSKIKLYYGTRQC